MSLLPPRHVILKAVSSQICSAIERVNSGAPTCMATTHLIAVGTQGGFVLVFDSCQVLEFPILIRVPTFV